MTSGSPEELRDLVLGEGGQRFAPAAAHQREALAALHDLADEVTVDALARERVDDDGRVAGGERHEERPRRDRAERIETERLAERPALGQHDDPVPVDPEPDARGVGQLDERRRHPALRRVVHGVDRGELARDLDLGEHAEPGRPEEVPGLPDGRRRHAARAELGLLLARDDRRALERHALRSEEHTSELQSRLHLVCRLLLEKKKETLYPPSEPWYLD